MAYVPIVERVAAGAELLDELYPEWEKQIDLDLIDMADGDRCIVGQLFGDYEGGLHDLGLGGDTEGADHGFYLPAPADWRDERWEALGEMWITEIRNRTGE